MMSLSVYPPPGSDEAVSLGCLCPRLDNGYGRGYRPFPPVLYVVSSACPLHGFCVSPRPPAPGT